MEGFTGEHIGKLDAKGRLVLPSRFKHALPLGDTEEVVLQLGLGPYLALYPLSRYKDLKARMDALDEFNELHRRLRRTFYRGTYPITLDKLGRLLIPPKCISYSSLTHEVTLVGVGKEIELWDPDTYQKHILSDPSQYSQAANRVMHHDKGTS